MTTVRNFLLVLLCFSIIFFALSIFIDTVGINAYSKVPNVVVTYLGKNNEDGKVSDIVITNKGMFFIDDSSKVLVKKLVPDSTYTFYTKDVKTGLFTSNKTVYSAYQE